MSQEVNCGDPDCVSCALHCPYCGEARLTLDLEAGTMACPRCGEAEDLPAPEFIHKRRAQVLALTGLTIAQWKQKAHQLSTGFHHRWRSTMAYLDPVACALIARADDLSRCGWTAEAIAQQLPGDRVELQRLTAVCAGMRYGTGVGAPHTVAGEGPACLLTRVPSPHRASRRAP